LVATTVAMELAVSWKPLMNSNTSAARITTRTRDHHQPRRGSASARPMPPLPKPEMAARQLFFSTIW
jgi:hypothetical protein